jgi:hypothetical protein
LADRDDLVHIRVSIQHIRCPAVYERIDAGIRISEPEGTEERGRQENVPDMACGNQEDVLSREFHREIKVSDSIFHALIRIHTQYPDHGSIPHHDRKDRSS